MYLAVVSGLVPTLSSFPPIAPTPVKSSGNEIAEGPMDGGRAVDKNGQRVSFDDHMEMENWEDIQTEGYYERHLSRE